MTFRRAKPITLSASIALFAFSMPAQAQVSVGVSPPLLGPSKPVCIESGGAAATLAVSKTGDCTSGVSTDYVPANGVYFGNPFNPVTLLKDNGDASFGGNTDFSGATTFDGSVQFNGTVGISGSISAAGLTSTSGFTNTGSFTSNGSGTFTGTLNADRLSSATGNITGLLSTGSLNTGSISATSLLTTAGVTVQGFLNAQGGASIGGTTQLATARVSQSLTVSNGATVSMGGNVVQNVAAGVAPTDAVNVSQLTATNTRVTSLENFSAQQNTRVASIETVNVQQDTRLTSLETSVGGLNTTIDLNRRQANGGIAAAMAMGGAVIVPDSNVSVNFNLATYRGELGFSGSVAGRVAPKVYITAGFTGSTVKGSTGARVGMAFGF